MMPGALRRGGMRVSIDSTPLLLRSAGVKTYVYHWTRHLRQAAAQHALSLFPSLPFPDRCAHERSVLGPAATWSRLLGVFAVNGAGRLRCRPLNPWARRLDIFHASHQLLNPPTSTRVTATLYDLTCWLLPETHSAATLQGAKAFADRVVKSAAGLIAISGHTRDDAVRILGLRPERIAVIYPGVAPAFFDPPAPAPAASRRGLQRPYILFVGTIEPRKNVAALLDAYGALPQSLREEFDLVVVGSPGWKDESTLARLGASEPGVRYLGYVPEDDLPALTAGATVFAYPSLYEGFGLPVAQAMAAGVPVVTSHTSALPEITGEAALHVDPRSSAELAAALARLLLSPALRSRLRDEGRRRAQRFRWEVCAEQSWDFFEKTAGRL
jgi:alpha-1,3-rhamnosyl/mannosyltransferase